MTIRLRSRDGTERVTLPSPYATVGHLREAIQAHLGVPIVYQTLSTDQNLLLAKMPHELYSFSSHMRDPAASLFCFGISHGSVVYLAYPWERSVPGGRHVAGEPRIVTIADLVGNPRMDVGDGAIHFVVEPQLQQRPQQIQSFLPALRDPDEAVMEATAAVRSLERKRIREGEAAFTAKRMRKD
ncbi:NPL4-like protein 1 [Aristolochia californica]|uniref:NPL4-like protein 1 n=1 Tax=Aristolochia californica TaxID=171875 RepID=UPI0035DC57E9